MIVFLLVVSFVINILLGYLLYRLSKRLLEYSSAYEDMQGSVDSLVEFCQEIAKNDLITNAPEVVKFHRMVMQIAQSFGRSDG